MHANEIKSESWEAEIPSVIKAWLGMIKQLPDAEITYLFIGHIVRKDLQSKFSPTSLAMTAVTFTKGAIPLNKNIKCRIKQACKKTSETILRQCENWIW